MPVKRNFIVMGIVAILVLGGIMGILKVAVPSLQHFDYRYLLTRTSTFNVDNRPFCVTIYGLIMALLEMACVVVYFRYTSSTIKFVIAILVINAIGCLIAILLGDLLASVSLIIRLLMMRYLIKICHRLNR